MRMGNEYLQVYNRPVLQLRVVTSDNGNVEEEESEADVIAAADVELLTRSLAQIHATPDNLERLQELRLECQGLGASHEPQ